MSSGQKCLLSVMCVCIIIIPFVLLISPEKSTKDIKETEIKKPASGIFIIPPDEVLVDRDTTGERVVYHNIGDKIVIDVVGSIIPEATYFVNAGKTPSVKITKRRTILTVIGLLKNYVRFKNFGTETARVRVIIIPRKKYR